MNDKQDSQWKIAGLLPRPALPTAAQVFSVSADPTGAASVRAVPRLQSVTEGEIAYLKDGSHLIQNQETERGLDVSIQASDQRPLALVGRRIPSRNASVRRRVVALFAECHWLTRADLPAATRWATLLGRFQRIAERLDALTVVKADDEPRKLDAELRALSASLSGLERDLGITASARAALGVNISRMADPAALLRGLT